ncbi:13878_t:CDS:2 [Funneliformis mosseae]|uniref:13878_t:CDS:1 n=1 Tax=Funneliformis mosseae TaxID=27381 RepID=A0A9N9EVN4_FUNMO|nr:13878_t:CDS:2 [Funneliformis mosseae]
MISPTQPIEVREQVLDSDLAKLKKYIIRSPQVSIPELCRLFDGAITSPSPSGSVANRHITWDLLVKIPLEVVSSLFHIKIICDRDKQDLSTATIRLKRPDLFGWLKSALVFKGEEKEALEDIAKAEHELLNKAKLWNPLYFGNLQYIFAYVAAGNFIRSLNIKVVSQDFDLSLVVDRILTVVTSINITRCLLHFIPQIPTNMPYPLYSVIKRGTCEITFLEDRVTKKIRNFETEYNFSTFNDLKNIYAKSANESHFIQAVVPPHIKNSTYTVELSPLGINRCPQSLQELKRAIKCVLEALVVLHRSKYVHRDIRWDNVIQSSTNSMDWILNDLEHAGKEGPVTYRLEWWPNGVGPNQGPYDFKCDLYLVGELIRTSGVDLSRTDTSFMNKLLEMESRFTTMKALKDIWLTSES